MPDKPFRFTERLRSFRYAGQGLLHAFRVTHNFYIHTGMAVLVVAAALWLQVSAAEAAVLALCIGAVSAAEVFNTAIEALVDLLHPEQDPRAGRVKDLAAGAVLICAVAAAAAGLFILLPPLLSRLGLA
ncbi:MAG: diacylglycerol kinase family protein [Bacteroidetes bacterium]|nr:diacylglycerol kinase family protein [Bacteroidota bacterium]